MESKYCMNYNYVEYELIDENGYSCDRDKYVYKWDDSDYRNERDEEEEDR